MNQLYQMKKGEILFLENVIDSSINTTDYKIQIEITALPINPQNIEASFYIEVLPTNVKNQPIHFIKGNQEIECYTGPNNNKCYFVYTNYQDNKDTNYFFYSKVDNSALTKIKIYAKLVSLMSLLDLEDINWEKHFPNSENYSIVSQENETYLNISSNLIQNSSSVVICFLVEGTDKNLNIKTYFSKKIKSTSLLINTRIPHLYYIESFSTLYLDYYKETFNNSENYEYKLEITKVKGNGKVYFNSVNEMNGYIVYSINMDNNDEIPLKISSYDSNLLFIIKYSIEPKKEVNVDKLKLNLMDSLNANITSFPLKQAYLLDQNLKNFTLNVKFSKSFYSKFNI